LLVYRALVLLYAVLIFNSPDDVSLDVGDPYTLPCGHPGKIKSMNNLFVKITGPIRQPFCEKCKPRKEGTPTTFVFPKLRGNMRLIYQALTTPMTSDQLYKKMLRQNGWTLPRHTVNQTLSNLKHFGYIHREGHVWQLV